MDLARSLRAEARRSNERRMLVLAGEADRTRDRAAAALDAADVPRAETTVIGPESVLDCERHSQARAEELLGRTQTAVVLDAHEELRPDAVGRTVGAVDGGGLYVLLAPPLDRWPETHDAFSDSLAVPPFDTSAVTGHFRRRFVETLRAHRGVAVVDVDTGAVEADGLTDPPPHRPKGAPTPPADGRFPRETYAQCRTEDQRDAVQALETLTDPAQAVVVEADRGRGKSSAAGLAAGALAATGADVLVTAPQYRSAAEVFTRAMQLFETLGVEHTQDPADTPRRLDVDDGGRVRYSPPEQAETLPESPDAVVVDEAAALPVRRLARFLDAPAVAFTTTVHGYEGAGRGFSVRFRDRLAESDYAVMDVSMTAPIRYSEADPVEVWAFRALLLDARPPAAQLVDDATPETVSYRRLSAAALRADEHLLREVFGLLVLAHYRTEPSDLARLLDAPNLTVRALTHAGHVVAVALLAREGSLSAETRATMYDGNRVRGNLIPDVLSAQLRDEAAGIPAGQRVLRIATHAAVRSRGLGSHLLSAVRAEFADTVDWLGVGYGATPELVRFWDANGYNTVHLATSQNATSGEYSVLMLDSCSDAGEALAARHGGWFRDRIAAVLSDPLDDCAPDVVRAVLRATDGEGSLSLSDWEWRALAGVSSGASTLDTNPRPFRELARRHLAAPADPTVLTERAERLLVRKVLQAQPWPTVTEELGFVSQRACMRTLGGAVERLTRLYGDTSVTEELDSHR